MGYYIFIMLLSMFLNNCDSITPIHIWLIEFFIFAIIAVIVLYIQENAIGGRPRPLVRR